MTAEGARRDVADTTRRWSQRGYFLSHFWCLLANGSIDLYAGEPEAALDLVRREWPSLTRSLLPRSVQLIRVESLHLRARPALAVAARGAAGKGAALERADSDARAIEAEGTSYSRPIGRLLRAGVAFQRGDRACAVSSLDEAIAGFEGTGMALYAAIARYRRGALQRSDEGVRVAEGWMQAEDIRVPHRMAAVFAPGLPAPS